MTQPTNNSNTALAAPKRPPSPVDEFRHMLTSPKMRDQLALALPRTGLDVERLTRIVLTTIQRTPALLGCTRQSVLGAIMQAAQLGLEPDNVMGLAYLLPYGQQCQLIIGYKGLIELARRSGQIASIRAEVVRRGDFFHYELGLTPTLRHVPMDMLEFAADDVRLAAERRGALNALADAGKASELVAAYAVVKLKDGSEHFRVVTKSYVDRVRAMSRGASNAASPWQQWPEPMWSKTAIKQVLKFVPLSPDDKTLQALAADNRVISGLSPVGEILAVDSSGQEVTAEAIEPEAEPEGATPSALDNFVAQRQAAPADQTPAPAVVAPVAAQPAPAAEAAPKKRGRSAKTKPANGEAPAPEAAPAPAADVPPVQGSLFDDAD